MNQLNRIGEYAALATVAVMFVVLVVTAPLLDRVAVSVQAAAGAVALLASWGFYRSALTLFFAAFSRSRRVRRHVLSSDFIEGTWVGEFDRDDGRHRTVERIDQSGQTPTIEGVEYNATGGVHATWRSTSASIDSSTSELRYLYDCDVMDPATLHQGLAKFTFEGTTGEKYPVTLRGYAADLKVDGGHRDRPGRISKDPNIEKKVNDRKVSDEEALAMADEDS